MTSTAESPTAPAGDQFPSVSAAIRRHKGLSLVRLREDLVGASRVPVFLAGAIVEARWIPATRNWIAGWQVEGCGFSVRLTNDQVVIVND